VNRSVLVETVVKAAVPDERRAGQCRGLERASVSPLLRHSRALSTPGCGEGSNTGAERGIGQWKPAPRMTAPVKQAVAK
jgi:hypothetical protein